MKKIFFVAALVVLFASNAFAATHAPGGLGFHKVMAPIGLRWWMGPEQKMAIDVGIGVKAHDQEDETLTDFTLEGGLPILIQSWEHVHLAFRPGILFTSYSQIVGTGADRGTERGTDFQILAELETEVFLAENVSVSAAHGFGVDIDSPPGENVDSSTSYGTTGNEFTEIGFHIYFLGD